MEETTTNYLQDIEPTLVRATAGQRLANYIIDIIAFYVLMIVLGILIGLLAPSLLDSFETGPGFSFIDRIVSLFLYALYMFAVEAIFKGKSLGKLITKTRAVNTDGSQINATKALQRGFSRAVPFCAFSALGTPCNPWQDSWTDTMVIDEKELQG
jgi:uncharacterized RDD family membrane protein YckC